MAKLKNNATYYFSNRDSFINSIDNAHYFIMKDYWIGMHKQEFFEINIIVRGEGVHYIEDGTVEARVGDVFIIPPEVPHGYTGGEGFDVYHITINNEFIRKNIADLQTIEGFSMLFDVEPMMRTRANKHLHLKLSKEQFKSIEEILNEREGNGNFFSPSEAFVCLGTLLIIITRLCKVYIENSAALDGDTAAKDIAFMRALALIHERYNEKLTVDELARVAQLSRSTFIRRFFQICKMSPAEYITRKRIEIAENMLIYSNSSLMEITEKVGFYDAAHFSRTFKRINGMSPSEYRRLYSKMRYN